MGRRPIGAVAMTPAERQRRRIDRLREGAARPVDVNDMDGLFRAAQTAIDVIAGRIAARMGEHHPAFKNMEPCWTMLLLPKYLTEVAGRPALKLPDRVAKHGGGPGGAIVLISDETADMLRRFWELLGRT